MLRALARHFQFRREERFEGADELPREKEQLEYELARSHKKEKIASDEVRRRQRQQFMRLHEMPREQ